MKQILLNNNPHHFQKDDLPILIHGAEHTGSSIFTVTLMADFFRQRHKILFLCGYQMARDEFISQISNQEETILTHTNDDLKSLREKQVIFVKREDGDWFIKLVENLPDINERIILIKNVELFDKIVLDAVKNKTRVVVSGDLGKCAFKNLLLQKEYHTKIFFSPLDSIQMPNLQKFYGFLIQSDKEGIVATQI